MVTIKHIVMYDNISISLMLLSLKYWHDVLSFLAATDDVRYRYFVQGCVNGHNIVKYTDKTVLECQALCTENDDCMAFEYGVAYGGRGGEYQPRDCQLQDSADRIACDGSYHNLDLYVKGDFF